MKIFESADVNFENSSQFTKLRTPKSQNLWMSPDFVKFGLDLCRYKLVCESRGTIKQHFRKPRKQERKKGFYAKLESRRGWWVRIFSSINDSPLILCNVKSLTIFEGNVLWVMQADQVNVELSFAICLNLGHQYESGGLQADALNIYIQSLKNTQVW